ncbi:hypothetical protein BDF22DRAFT_695491 [Syncephalis plumigaleata]|nr:hypothetical protein BDF22DRAFT_695491 [Syncephalis plumigaleata]
MSHSDTGGESPSSSNAGDSINKQEDNDKIAESTATNLDTGSSTNDNSLVWGSWQACWDQDSQAYYYWNADTNETTWICPWATAEYSTETPPLPESPPADAISSSNSTTTPSTRADHLSSTSEQYPAINDEDAEIYADFMSSRGDSSSGTLTGGGYAASARFNARTGRFQADATLCPENYTVSARMQRQCDAFFDYNSFAEERATGNKRARLTKQQLERAKKRHKEKREARKRAWLNAID